MNLLNDTLKYFAKFPQRSAVLEMFNKGTSDIPEYAFLKSQVENLPEHTLFPIIRDFIFDVSEETVVEKINSLPGVFMFVDYGDMRMEQYGPARVQQHFFTLAVTIAQRTTTPQYDNVERLIISDEMHALLHRIIGVMQKDSDAFCKRISFPYSATPAIARTTFQAIGWTVKFELKNIE